MRCAICNEDIKGVEHNAFPVVSGVCCERCNNQVVIPFQSYQLGKNTREALVINPDYSIKIVRPIGEKFQLKELQEEVQGYIEYYPTNNPRYKIIVNEEGLLMRLPMNKLSSNIFGIHAVGNVVIVPKKLIE